MIKAESGKKAKIRAWATFKKDKGERIREKVKPVVRVIRFAPPPVTATFE
jgi:hypothetical protein